MDEKNTKKKSEEIDELSYNINDEKPFEIDESKAFNSNEDSHILEYLKGNEDSKKPSEIGMLFDSGRVGEIALKTEMNAEQINLLLGLKKTSDFLKSRGINSEYFDDYIDTFQRFNVSKDRKSRSEFVEVKKADVQRLREEQDALNRLNQGVK